MIKEQETILETKKDEFQQEQAQNNIKFYQNEINKLEKQIPDKALAEVEESIEFLKFVPDRTVKKKHKPAHFVAKLKENGREIELSPLWVYENFHEEQLITTMSDGYDGGFVEVELKALEKSKEQACALKCVGIDKEGKPLANKEWYIKKVNVRKPELVPYDWVRKNFSETFINELKRKSDRPGFIVVPPGRARAKSKKMKMFTEVAPSMQYLQHDKKHCLHYSFASALYFLNFKKVAQIIQQDAFRSAEWVDSWTSILKIMKEHLSFLQPVRYGDRQLNPLEDKSRYPTLMILIGTDGFVDHAVTTVGDWLFDSNRETAEKISLEILDWCVSNDEESEKFVGVSKAYRFIERDIPKKKRNRYEYEYIP